MMYIVLLIALVWALFARWMASGIPPHNSIRLGNEQHEFQTTAADGVTLVLR